MQLNRMCSNEAKIMNEAFANFFDCSNLIQHKSPKIFNFKNTSSCSESVESLEIYEF